MKASPRDNQDKKKVLLQALDSRLDSVSELTSEQTAQLLIPVMESVDINLSHQIEDLSHDTALGFSEVHGKIEYLRAEISEIKRLINSLSP